MTSLETRVSNIMLKHPVMNASGLLVTSVESIDKLADAGVSAIVTKTLTKKPREGYKPPIIVPLRQGLLNAVGLANPGIDAVYDLVRRGHEHGLPVIVSLSGKDVDEMVYVASKAVDAGADALELNLSCPHTPGYGKDLTSDLKVLRDIVSSVKGITDKPVWAKLGYSDHLIKFADVVIDAGSDVLVLINTLPGMAIDVFIGKPILSNKFGGLSGQAIHPIAIYCVYTVYREYGIDIVGVGGVYSWMDAIEFIMAGARAIQLATAVYLEGYGVFRKIVNGIQVFLKDMGYRSIDEIVGIAHRF